MRIKSVDLEYLLRKLAPETRHRVMASIKSKDTRPELLLRKALWKQGIRYRVNLRIDSIRVDIAIPKDNLALFIDGCFWHGCPAHYRRPMRNEQYWNPKLERNQARDARNKSQLESNGWTVLRIWEHEVREELDKVTELILELIRQNACELALPVPKHQASS